MSRTPRVGARAGIAVVVAAAALIAGCGAPADDSTAAMAAAESRAAAMGPVEAAATTPPGTGEPLPGSTTPTAGATAPVPTSAGPASATTSPVTPAATGRAPEVSDPYADRTATGDPDPAESPSADASTARGTVADVGLPRGPISLERAQPLDRPAVWIPRRGGTEQPWPRTWTQPVQFPPARPGPLSGVTIAVDPGHNSSATAHIDQINETYWVGLTKACNTTGTATTGLAESAYNFDVARRLATNLTNAGATVLFTRGSDTDGRYGPCIGGRGAFGEQQNADFKISIHADGIPGPDRGFHVIIPGGLPGYTDDIQTPSRRLGRDVVAAFANAGFPPAQYLASPVSVRDDQGTLNMSDIPTVIVETLNMANPTDARLARSKVGRQRIADALTVAATAFAQRRQ